MVVVLLYHGMGRSYDFFLQGRAWIFQESATVVKKILLCVCVRKENWVFVAKEGGLVGYAIQWGVYDPVKSHH